MAALINVDDVQSWFTTDRLQLEITDALPEEPNVSRLVLATVDGVYDTSTWVSTSTTPKLIRSVISARVAAIRYRKRYADQLDELTYADWLDDWATTTLEGIVNGQIKLLDADDLDDALAVAGPDFYPTDQSSEDDPAVFSMGQKF